MKLELKENMYVRTNDGYIAKYDKSKHNCSGKYYGFASTIRDMRWEEYDDDCFLWESELKNIVKASYNIIDILEKGDYVNGVEIINIDNEWITMSDKQVPILKSIANGMIKSVVTHEQMKQIAYKVEE